MEIDLSKNNLHKRRLVRKHYVLNPLKSIHEVARNFNIDSEIVFNWVKSDLPIVKCLHEENLYFVFDGISERKIITDSELLILNQTDFLAKELYKIKTFGFKL